MIIALLVIAAVSLFVTLIAILVNLVMMMMLQRDSRELLTLVQINTGRLANTETLALALHSMFAGIPRQHPGFIAGRTIPPDRNAPSRTFKTEDGRHQADNFEELMHKLADDDRYRIADPNDIEHLRQAFEEYQDTLNDDAEDDDGDIPGEEWKRGKRDGPQEK